MVIISFKMWLFKHHVQCTCPTTPEDFCMLFRDIVMLMLWHVPKHVVILNWELRTAKQLVTQHGDASAVLMCISTFQQLEMAPSQHWDWSNIILGIMPVEEDVDQTMHTVVVHHTSKCRTIYWLTICTHVVVYSTLIALNENYELVNYSTCMHATTEITATVIYEMWPYNTL